MKHEAFIAHVLSTPWALQREYMVAYAGVLARNLSGDKAEYQAKARPAAQPARGGIAVIPVTGVVMQRANMMQDICGWASTQQISAALREALADETVSQILLDIDSPGGSVYGVGELAAEIYAARSAKPIVAVSNSLAASAAYWIGSAASEFYVTPGGEVGSIGVWQAHEDWSKALDEAGVKTTLISAGKFKAEGNPYEPLSQEARDFMQLRTDEYYSAFTKAVAKGRGVGIDAVRSGMGQGRVLGADAALAENMVDGIATFDEVVKKMQRAAKPARSALKAAQNRLALIQ